MKGAVPCIWCGVRRMAAAGALTRAHPAAHFGLITPVRQPLSPRYILFDPQISCLSFFESYRISIAALNWMQSNRPGLSCSLWMLQAQWRLAATDRRGIWQPTIDPQQHFQPSRPAGKVWGHAGCTRPAVGPEPGAPGRRLHPPRRLLPLQAGSSRADVPCSRSEYLASGTPADPHMPRSRRWSCTRPSLAGWRRSASTR